MEINKEKTASNILIIYKKNSEGVYQFNDFAFVDKYGKILNGEYEGKTTDSKTIRLIENPLERVNSQINNFKLTTERGLFSSEALGYIVKLNEVKFNSSYTHNNIERAAIIEITDGIKSRRLLDENNKLYNGELNKLMISVIIEHFVKIEIDENKNVKYYPNNSITLEEIEKGIIKSGIQKLDDNFNIQLQNFHEIAEYIHDNLSAQTMNAPKTKYKPVYEKDKNQNIPVPKQKKSDSNEPQQISKEELDKRREFVTNIKTKLKNKFICQEDAVDQLVSTIYRLSTTIHNYDENTFSIEKGGVLLDGPTGTGKTAIMCAIAKELERPIVITGANKYTSEGYVGESLSNILQELLAQTNGDLEKAETGIIYFDEFDKLRMNKNDNGGRDNIFKEGIQDELLKFLDGQDYRVNGVPFNTSKLTIVCGGAFTDLRESKKETKEKKEIGFLSEQKDTKTEGFTFETDDYVTYGIKSELVGRLKTKLHTKGYSKEDYKRILLESEISPLKTLRNSLFYVGATLEYDEEFLDECAELAVEINLGVRGLQSIFDNMKNSDFQLNDIINFGPSNEDEKTVMLTKERIAKLKQANIRKA